MRGLLKNFLLFFLAFIVIAGIFSTYQTTTQKPKRIDLPTFFQHIEAGEIKSIVVQNEELSITLQDESKEVFRKERTESLGELFKNYGIAIEKTKAIAIEVQEESGLAFWIANLLPFLIPFILIAVFIYIMLRQVQGANTRALMFGQSSARETTPNDKNKTTFKDIAGVKEAKEELQEVVEFLKNQKKFIVLGAKIPKGVLLIGPPGTGKTLIARAVAGEANVPFFHMSGSEFVEMFVGVGAARVRDLFRKAKKNSPCIVFVDELDAVGRQRGSGLGGSHDEREQTLNQILVEMDGFDPNVGIIVIAATNRPDVLDPALLRPGRFDRQVILDIPDMKDREEILKIHAKNKPLGSSVSLRTIAERTPGFTGADLANLLNEAAILTARKNKKQIDVDEVLSSIEKVLLGPERKSHILSPKEKKITAYHEGGHALVAHILPNADPVRKVSIVSRGKAAGFTLKLPTNDKHLHSKAEFLDDLAVMLAGHVAEKLIFRNVTTGASNDLKQATRLARQIVTQFGMSEKLGLRTFGEREELIFLGREIHESRDYSEHVAQLIDEEISKLITHATKTAESIIKKEHVYLEKIVEHLIAKETIEQGEFEAIFASKEKIEPKFPRKSPVKKVMPALPHGSLASSPLHSNST